MESAANTTSSPTPGDSPAPEPTAITLMDLPTELHILVSSYLPYPDALALKHTCRHFYYLVYTGVHLKIDWLVDRFNRKLECPMESCCFRTDESFCNQRVRRVMERRRRHLECRRAPGGCFVVEGQTCQANPKPMLWWKGRTQQRLMKSVEDWGNEVLIICLVFLLVICCGSSWEDLLTAAFAIVPTIWICSRGLEGRLIV